MAFRYYDDIIAAKITGWMPSAANIRVLRPDETKQLFETLANDSKHERLTLPLIALSRNNDITLDLNIKNSKSYDGYRLSQDESGTSLLNTIPVKLMYQMDIFAKKVSDAEDYVREYLFKIINNPTVKIGVPNASTNASDDYLYFTANMRVLDTVSDTSSIPQRLFTGQFSRWTIQIELQDAYLFNIPYKQNWKLYIDENNLLPDDQKSVLELASNLSVEPAEEKELLDFNLKQVSK